jgi:WD40 repeat protein
LICFLFLILFFFPFDVQSAVTWLCFAPNSEQIITASKDGSIRIWNINGVSKFYVYLLSFVLVREKFNPLPLNEQLEEEYTFSQSLSKSQSEIEEIG